MCVSRRCSAAGSTEQLRHDLAEREKRIEAILQEAESLSKKQAAQELTIRTLRQTTKKAEDDAAEATTKRVRNGIRCYLDCVSHDHGKILSIAI